MIPRFEELSEPVQMGIEEVLAMLTDAELFSIVRTVTNGGVTVVSRLQAISSIKLFEDDPQSLLDRRVVKKAYLVRYCDLHNIAPGNRSLTKPSVVRNILQHWSEQAAA